MIAITYRTMTRRSHRNLPDLKGQVFGRLTVVEYRGLDRHGQRVWLCRCICGNETIRPGAVLKHGNTKSCGCLHDDVRRSKKGTKLPQLSVGHGIAARNAVIAYYRNHAKTAGRVWLLTTEQAEVLFRGNCHYCGREPSQHSSAKKLNGDYIYNGIDRIDNLKGYEPDNVVSCCRACNYAKNKMTYQDFLEWVNRVYWNLFQKAHAN